MIIDIAVGVFVLCFAILTIFLVRAAINANTVLKQMKTSLSHIEKELTPLLQDTKELVDDLKHKTKALNFLFKPLSFFTPSGHNAEKGLSEAISQAATWISSGIKLFKHFKGEK